MWIRVKSVDGTQSESVKGLSKLTKIEDLRKKLVEPFKAPVKQQRLIFKGKQLEDGYTLFDYNVGVNDTVIVVVKPVLDDLPATKKDSQANTPDNVKSEPSQDKENKLQQTEDHDGVISESKYFKVGDIVDAKDDEHGAWFEAKILEIQPLKISASVEDERGNGQNSSEKIMQEIGNNKNVIACDSLIEYHVEFEGYKDDEDVLPLERVRPRAKTLLKFQDISEGDLVMVNYNVENPNQLGFWYDCKVTKKSAKELWGSVYIGLEGAYLENCKIKSLDEIYAIPKLVPLSEKKDESSSQPSSPGPSGLRSAAPRCPRCKDNPSRKCKECGCQVCGMKNKPDKLLLCDECNLPYHIWCLTPPLSEVPDCDDWYCPQCKNDDSEIVKAGEKLKVSKKKMSMPSAKGNSARDWGKGMACVGRSKQCTIVQPNHFGPIPGIEVGMAWRYRFQVSECGVHRPMVAGIHGRETDGAYSIVLSGGYEDDLDEGNEFKYTGSGGRDLSGNKRTADQSCDQKLTRTNKALALNCNTKFDDKKGGEASDWKKGKPVRVVRNSKGRKHSKYCPEVGNRYDGIYKVVKYWPEPGKSGFLVWRYLLRRDDPVPAPWTKAGKKRIEELGITMENPEGYVEIEEKEEESSDQESKPKNKKRKRSRKVAEDNSDGEDVKEEKLCLSPKKPKQAYKLPSDVTSLVAKDTTNSKTWVECQNHLSDGYRKFIQEVERSFSCTCCLDVVVAPITTECCHNICKECLKRSFKAEVYCCPVCRTDLGKDYVFKVNTVLSDILLKLFPGYNVGR